MAVALAVMAVPLALAGQRLDWLAMQQTPVLRALWLAAVVAAAAGAYFAALYALGFRPADFRRRAR